jgi:dTDP-glucose pyrophosphorylase
MSLRDALLRIDASGIQIAVVVDAKGCLLGLLSDGDVRRALLRGVDLSIRCAEVMNTYPVVAESNWSRQELMAVMRRKVLHHIPIVDSNLLVTGLATLDEFAGIIQHSNWVVLMAGGLGARLRPLTDNCPKPMLHVGGKPILENILESFIEQGFCNFFISVNYLSEIIIDYFGDGSRWGVSISYLREDKRLGTAGALSLLPSTPNEPFFVMNGDLLTKIRLDAILQFHKEQKASATMAVREYDFQVPYGVVRMNGEQIEAIEEKPVHKFFVNAGIYVLTPEVMGYVKSDQHLDMPNLFEQITAAGSFAAAYPLREFWIDVGQLEEFKKAQDEWVDK